jgi:hypothetical protein
MSSKTTAVAAARQVFFGNNGSNWRSPRSSAGWPTLAVASQREITTLALNNPEIEGD